MNNNESNPKFLNREGFISEVAGLFNIPVECVRKIITMNEDPESESHELIQTKVQDISKALQDLVVSTKIQTENDKRYIAYYIDHAEILGIDRYALDTVLTLTKKIGYVIVNSNREEREYPEKFEAPTEDDATMVEDIISHILSNDSGRYIFFLWVYILYIRALFINRFGFDHQKIIEMFYLNDDIKLLLDIIDDKNVDENKDIIIQHNSELIRRAITVDTLLKDSQN